MPFSDEDLRMIAVIMADSRVRTALITGEFELAKRLLETEPGAEVTLTEQEYVNSTPIKANYNAKNPMDLLKPDVAKVLVKRYRHDVVSPIFGI